MVKLELLDIEGNFQKWDIFQRSNLKDVQLPNLDNVNGAERSLSNLLRRRDASKSLNERVKDRGENLVYIVLNIVIALEELLKEWTLVH